MSPSSRRRVERCHFAASYQLSASVNNVIKCNQCYIKHYVNVHVPHSVLGAVALMLWHFAVSHHGKHIQTLKSLHLTENRPCLFTSRTELYLTIIRHRTECPVCPFHLAPVWPWSTTWIWCTRTLAPLQSSIDRTHNKQAVILTRSTSETQSINIRRLCFSSGLVCMRWRNSGSNAPRAWNKSGEDDCSSSPFSSAILRTSNEVPMQNSQKIIWHMKVFGSLTLHPNPLFPFC